MGKKKKKLIPDIGIDDLLLKKLQTIKEKELTLEYLVPLFKVMGYEKTDYHGGVYEEGKDLICWKTDELGVLEVHLVQVKRYKPSASSSGDKSFSTIVNQISQALENEIPNIDGHHYKPRTVFFITPFSLDTRALQSRFAKLKILSSNTKIIDGEFLVKLLKNHLPDKVSKLIGDEYLIKDITPKILNNKDLMRALHSETDKEISSFYTDLDFGLGRITSRIFFALVFNPKKVNVKLTSSSWIEFKKLNDLSKKTFDTFLINDSTEKIEETFNTKKTTYNKNQQQIKKIEKEFSKILQEIEKIVETIVNRDIIKTRGYANIRKLLEKFIITRDTAQRLASFRKDKQGRLTKGLEDQIIKLGSKTNSYLTIEKRKDELVKNLISPTYNFELNGEDLSNKLKLKQNWLAKEAEKINNSKNRNRYLKPFLVECKNLFETAEKLLSESNIRDAVGIEPYQKYRDITKATRFNFSIHDVFELGENLAIFGEAGAGKTTTLQMYVKSRLPLLSTDRRILFIPLAKAMSSYLMQNVNRKGITEKQQFFDLIITHFQTLNIPIDKSSLLSILHTKSTQLLLDGLDEVIEEASWLIKAINDTVSEYNKVQIVVTARMSGEYISHIPFLGITLLPFTDLQRSNFIKNWLHESPRLAQDIINHLKNKKELNNIVRNPLLCTILCVLRENNVPLPDSEVRLYAERMRLLLGHYDIHKRAVRLKSHSDDLELVARKAAYTLHNKETRQAPFEILRKNIILLVGELLTPDKINLALRELVDPCNILLPMTNDGQIGFGHLRFQEYLAALELNINRNISIPAFINRNWWRGAMHLYSQMADNIEFIITELAVTDSVYLYEDILREMIALRPKSKRAGLYELIEMYVSEDRFPEYDDEEF